MEEDQPDKKEDLSSWVPKTDQQEDHEKRKSREEEKELLKESYREYEEEKKEKKKKKEGNAAAICIGACCIGVIIMALFGAFTPDKENMDGLSAEDKKLIENYKNSSAYRMVKWS